MALVTGIAEGRIPLPSGEGPNTESSFGLEHLAGVLNSDREDVLVPGLRLAVQQFAAQDGKDNNSRAGLLDAYIESSPQAVELQSLWKTVTRRPSSPSLMTSIMTVLAIVVPKCHSLAKWLVHLSIPDILAQTSRKMPFDCVKRALLLLIVLARIGGGTAKALVKRIPFSESTFIHLTAPPPEGDIHIRYLTLQLLSSFLDNTKEPSVQVACALTPGALNLAIHYPITKIAEKEEARVNKATCEASLVSLLLLPILKDQILLNVIIPRREKNDLFIHHHTQVVSILGTALVDRNEEVRRAALQLVTILCVDKKCSTWLNAGQKGRQCVLSMILRMGKGDNETGGPKYGPCYDMASRSVVGASLEVSPMIIGSYMKGCTSFCSLDPKPSLRGLLTYRYMSWILTNSPFDPSSTVDITTTISLALPPSVCKRDLTKAVLHTNCLLRCSGLMVVLSVLKRVDKIQRNSNVADEGNIQNALSKRIPDIQIILSLLSRLCSAANARSDAASIIAWNLLMEVLMMHQKVLPKAISSSKFDLAKIFPSSNGILTAPPSIQKRILLILGRADARQVSWLQSPSMPTCIMSPLALSLRILTSTPHRSLRNAAQCACLRALSLVAPEDAYVWVSSLTRNIYSMDKGGYSGGADFIASVALCVSKYPYDFAMHCITSIEIAREQFGLMTPYAYQDLGISLLSVAVLLILKGEFKFKSTSMACTRLKSLMLKTTMTKEFELCAADALQGCLLRSKDPLLCAAFFLHELISASPPCGNGGLGHGAFYLARALYRTSGLEWLNSDDCSINATCQRISKCDGAAVLQENGVQEMLVTSKLALNDLLFPILSFPHFANSLLTSNCDIEEILDDLNLDRISTCMAPEVCALLWSSYSHIQCAKAAKETEINFEFMKIRLKVTAKLILLAAGQKMGIRGKDEVENSHVWNALEIFMKSKMIISSFSNYSQADARAELIRGVVALLVVLSKTDTLGSNASRCMKISSISGSLLRSLCDSVALAVRESNWEILRTESGPLAACISWCDKESTGKVLNEILAAFPTLVSHYHYQYDMSDTTDTAASFPNEVNNLLLSLLDLADIDGTWSLTSCLMMDNVVRSPSTVIVDAVIARAGVLVVCCCDSMLKLSGYIESPFVYMVMTKNLKECCYGDDAATATFYCIALKLTRFMVSRSTVARAVLEKWVSEKEELVMKSKVVWPVLLYAANASGAQALFRELPSLSLLLRRIVAPSCQWLCTNVHDSEFNFSIQPLMAVLDLNDTSGIAGETTASALFRCLPVIWQGRNIPEDFLDLVCNALIDAAGSPTAHENLVLEIGECLLKRTTLACGDSEGSSMSSIGFSPSLTRTLFSFMVSPLGETVLAAPALSRHVDEFMLTALRLKFSDTVVLDTVRCIFVALNSNSKTMQPLLSSTRSHYWNVEDMHQRLLSHSAFLEVLLCENDNVHNIVASCSLLSFLVVLANSDGCRSPPPLSSALVKLLLSSYGMSMSRRDQLILRLLWLHGGGGGGGGGGCLAGASTQLKISSTLLQRTISTGKVSTTIKSFPVYRPLTPPRMEFESHGNEEESADAANHKEVTNSNISLEILDPAFVISALHGALSTKSITSKDLTDKGQLIGMSIMAISSDMVSMRMGGYACLHKARDLLSSSVNMNGDNRNFNIKQTLVLLERLHDGTSSSLNQIPFSSALFFAQTLHTIVCSPGSPASALVMSSLLQPPFIDLPRPNIPLLIFGKEANWTSRSFALHCLASSMRREEDVRPISQTRIIPRLLPLLDVVLKQDGKVKLEEDIISLLEAVAERGVPGAQYLVCGGGVVDWARARISKTENMVASSSFEPFNSRLLSIIHVVLERIASEENNKGRGDGIGMLLYAMTPEILAFAIKYAKVKGVVEMVLRILLVARFKPEPLLISSVVLDQLRVEIEFREKVEGQDKEDCGSSLPCPSKKIRLKQPEPVVWHPKPSTSIECSLLLQLICLKRAMVTSLGGVESTVRLLEWALMQLHYHPDLDLSLCFLYRLGELLAENPFKEQYLLVSSNPNIGYCILNLIKGLLSLGLQDSKYSIAALRSVIFLVTTLSTDQPDNSSHTKLLPSLCIHTAKLFQGFLKRHDGLLPSIEGGVGNDNTGEYVASTACSVLLSILITERNEDDRKLLKNIFLNLNPEGFETPSLIELEGLITSRR